VKISQHLELYSSIRIDQFSLLITIQLLIMATEQTGLLQIANTNADLLPVSLTGDLMLTTSTANQRIIVGPSNTTNPLLLTPSSAAISNLTVQNLTTTLPASSITPGTFQGTSASTYNFPGSVVASNLTITSTINAGTLRGQIAASNIVPGTFASGPFTFPGDVTVDSHLTASALTAPLAASNILPGTFQGTVSDTYIFPGTITCSLAASNIMNGAFKPGTYSFETVTMSNATVAGTLTASLPASSITPGAFNPGTYAFETVTMSNATVAGTLTASLPASSITTGAFNPGTYAFETVTMSNATVAGTLTASLPASSITTGAFRNGLYTFSNIAASNLTVASTINASNITATGTLSGTIAPSSITTGAFRNGLYTFSNIAASNLTVLGVTSSNTWSTLRVSTSNFTFVNSNVFVGIGVSNPSYPLHVVGSTTNANIFTNGDITAFSDARAKMDLRVINNALDKVRHINGYTYARVEAPEGRRMAGVVAQEVMEVLPEVIYTDDKGYLSVAYANMVSLLIEAIHELERKVDALSSKQ
jgi:hypothetical protein